MNKLIKLIISCMLIGCTHKPTDKITVNKIIGQVYLGSEGDTVIIYFDARTPAGKQITFTNSHYVVHDISDEYPRPLNGSWISHEEMKKRCAGEKVSEAISIYKP